MGLPKTCRDCETASILSGEPTGTLSEDGTYYVSMAGGDGASTYAILLLTDGFGLPLKNCKIIADYLARETDCDVWVPDLFNGRPLVRVDQNFLPKQAGQKISVWNFLKLVFATLSGLPTLIGARASKVDPKIRDFTRKIKEEKGYTKIGAVGYCYGGACAVRLGSTSLVETVVVCHPGGFTIHEVKAIKVPTAWACAEVDVFCSTAKRNEAEAVFAQRKGETDFVEYEFVDYKGTTHGFAARPNLAYPDVKEAYEQCLVQTIDWFKKTLV